MPSSLIHTKRITSKNNKQATLNRPSASFLAFGKGVPWKLVHNAGTVRHKFRPELKNAERHLGHTRGYRILTATVWAERSEKRICKSKCTNSTAQVRCWKLRKIKRWAASCHSGRLLEGLNMAQHSFGSVILHHKISLVALFILSADPALTIFMFSSS